MSHVSVRSRRIVVALSLAITLLLTSVAFTSPATADTPSRATSAGIARAIIAAINSERAHSHLPPLRSNSRLVSSAHSHNLAMARHNTMSHQLPGEAFFAARISRTGYNWSAAGENIAWTSDWTLRGASALQRYMYTERPPNDAHRRNILSRSFRDVGVDIYMDAAHHRLWLTEDIGRSR